jgi:hypothetical protein
MWKMMYSNSEARCDSWDGTSKIGNGVDRASRKKNAHGLRSQLGPRFLTCARESQGRELVVYQGEMLDEARALCGVVMLHMVDPQWE